MSQLETTCAKCGRRMTFTGGQPDRDGNMRVPFPVYCAKCDLINALLVERYTTHVRQSNPGD
jgi:hypothetical protein